MSLNQLAISALLTAAQAAPAEAEPSFNEGAMPATTPVATDPATPAPVLAQPAVAEPAPASVPPPQTVQLASSIGVYTDSSVQKRRMESFEAREATLKQMTIGFGVSTVILGAIGAGMIYAAPRASENQAVIGGFGGLFTAAASATAIGTIISGVVWGNHRNLKPLMF